MIVSMHTLIWAGLSVVGLLSSGANAHGYVTISRGKKCKDNLNSDCGGYIEYEPQSLEALKGYPNSGPPDGQLGSAGIGTFTRLNEQSSTRWHKTGASTGSYTFTWQFTANHRTSGYQYYITRPGWNQNAPLTRSTFESTPFCSVGWNGSQPPMTVSHTCNIPSDHTGYHVVMAVWTIYDTTNAFYNMVDLNLNGSSGSGSGSTSGGSTSTGSCGGGNRGNGVCADGTCCSQWGWCGCTAEHCISGQTCSGSSTSPGTCGGGSRGNGRCSNGMCCSQWGWCGCTSEHCINGQRCSRRLRGSGGFEDDVVAAVEQAMDEVMILGNNTTRHLEKEHNKDSHKEKISEQENRLD